MAGDLAPWGAAGRGGRVPCWAPSLGSAVTLLVPPDCGHTSVVLEMGTLTQDRGACEALHVHLFLIPEAPKAEEPPGRCLGDGERMGAGGGGHVVLGGLGATWSRSKL